MMATLTCISISPYHKTTCQWTVQLLMSLWKWWLHKKRLHEFELKVSTSVTSWFFDLEIGWGGVSRQNDKHCVMPKTYGPKCIQWIEDSVRHSHFHEIHTLSEVLRSADLLEKIWFVFWAKVEPKLCMWSMWCAINTMWYKYDYKQWWAIDLIHT